MINPYYILGLARGASVQEIKKAYHALVRKYHPDRNPNDDDSVRLFREISEAYEILSDPLKKAEHDGFGVALTDKPLEFALEVWEQLFQIVERGERDNE